MVTMLVSPTETKELEKIESMLHGKGVSSVISSIPETKGVDYLIPTPHGLYGIQRKEVPHDFLSSIMDGRLAKETSLMAQHLKYRVVLGVGRFKFYPDGNVYTGGPKAAYRFYEQQIDLMVFSIKLIKGIDVEFVDDRYKFVDYIDTVIKFMNKEKHVGLFSRPAAQSEWGAPSSEEFKLWILQGFPQVGPGLAENILKAFGKLPLKWDCEFGDLLHVPGIGQTRARKLWEILK